MIPSSPLVALSGAQGRLAQVIVPALAQDYPMIAISRQVGWRLATVRDKPLLASRLVEQSWAEFFSKPVPEGLETFIHTAWSNSPITAERQVRKKTSAGNDDLELLEKLAQHLLLSAKPPRLLFFSSGCVYGHTPLAGVDESASPKPLGRYAREKLAAESLLQTYRERGLPVTILRISNPYGFLFDPKNPQGVIGHLLHHLQERSCFSLWGENPLKDYLHIQDLIDALRLLLENSLEGTWNLSSGLATPLLEVIALLENLSGSKLIMERKAAHPWDANPSVLNSQALQTLLGWKPQYQIQEGLSQLIQSSCFLK